MVIESQLVDPRAVPLDADAVRAIRKSRTFFEIVAAPGFSPEALALLANEALKRPIF